MSLLLLPRSELGQTSSLSALKLRHRYVNVVKVDGAATEITSHVQPCMCLSCVQLHTPAALRCTGLCKVISFALRCSLDLAVCLLRLSPPPATGPLTSPSLLCAVFSSPGYIFPRTLSDGRPPAAKTPAPVSDVNLCTC